MRRATFASQTLISASIVLHPAYSAASEDSSDRKRAKPHVRRPGAAPKAGEPVYSRKDVSVADGVDGRPMWITYKDGVYDVTDFERAHPGGNFIKQAAGADVSAFWDVWAHHHHAPKVGVFLEKLRIGALKKEDQIIGKTMGIGIETDPYEAEPKRVHSLQTVFAERPYVSETPKAVLDSSYLTSAEALYVRNHAPVPDEAWVPNGESKDSFAHNHEVVFTTSIERRKEGKEDGDEEEEEEEERSFTVKQLLHRFGSTKVTSVIQCAGNRASEDIVATGPSGFSGTIFENITQGMVGNAEWEGIRLSDVLPALYPKECAATKRHGGGEWHVVFEGADGYSASTPLNRILLPDNKCLLATHMNGERLSPDHGYPLRAMIPGVAGARSVKWLRGITLQKRAVDAPWNSYYYKDDLGGQIQSLPLNSIILHAIPCYSRDSTNISKSSKKNNKKKKVLVSGVAYGGGSGNAISKVEVSTDGGRSWEVAHLKTQEIMPEKIKKKKDSSQTTTRDDNEQHTSSSHKNFGWVRWERELELELELDKHSGENSFSQQQGKVSVYCRATDSEGKTQPEVSTKKRGYLFNGWSKLDVAI